jgi:hypothetical protein
VLQGDALNIAATALEAHQQEKDISKHIKVPVHAFASHLPYTSASFSNTLTQSTAQLGIASSVATSELLLRTRRSTLSSSTLERSRSVFTKQDSLLRRSSSCYGTNSNVLSCVWLGDSYRR